jgi:hypothetical protein
MILYVDYARNDDTRLIEINTKEGKVRFVRFFKEEIANIGVLTHSLLIHILKSKPKQIIFDEVGNGIMLSECFTNLINELDFIDIKPNGELIYK